MNEEDYKIAYENVMIANKMLEKELDKFRPITSAYEMKKEIERLNNELENVKAHYETEAEAKYYEFIDKHESKLQQRIDKAIEYIKQDYEINKYSKSYLLEILKGEDND